MTGSVALPARISSITYMNGSGHGRRPAGALLALVLVAMLTLSGCGMLGSKPPAGPDESGIPPPSALDVPAEPGTEVPMSGPVPSVSNADRPAREPAAAVAVLYSAGTPAQSRIAERIGASLSEPDFAPSLIDIDLALTGTPVAIAPETDVRIVAAVGPGALDAARQRFPNAEIVFCQVLDSNRRNIPASSASTSSARGSSSPFALSGTPPTKSAPDNSMDGLHGVAAMPSPALQFAAWSEVDPHLERIGLISSAAFASAVPGAREAAEAIGARLEHRISTSDRETLYLFRRLAPEIDGLWLAPDSAILSAAVIDEMLGLAAELEIGVLVFSESLLSRGGLISVSAPEAQVADSVVALIRGIHAGGAGELPAETPLPAGDVQVNAAVAIALGLPAPARLEWLVHDE